MNNILSILKGPGLGIWALFFYLSFVYCKVLKTYDVSLNKLCFILTCFTIGYFISIHDYEFSQLFISFVGLITGVIFGIYSACKQKFKVSHETKNIEIEGSMIPLIIFLLFFITKFTFGFLKATSPLLAIKYKFVEIIIQSMFFGYSIGRYSKYIYNFKHKSII